MPVLLCRMVLLASHRRAASVFRGVRSWRLNALNRSEILSLLKESRVTCPNSTSFSSNILLRGEKSARISGEIGRDFELHLKMLLGRESREFFRRYVSDHGLKMKEMDRSIIIYASEKER